MPRWDIKKHVPSYEHRRFFRLYLRTVLTIFFVGLAVSLLAFICFYSELKNTKSTVVEEAGRYIIDGFGSAFERSDLTELAQDVADSGPAYSLTENAYENVFVYRLSDGMIFRDYESTSVPARLRLDRVKVHIIDDKIYTPIKKDGVIFWFVASASHLQTVVKDYITTYITIFFIAFLCMCVLLVPLLLLFIVKPDIVRLIYVLVFLGIMTVHAVFVTGMLQMKTEYQRDYISARLNTIAEDAEAIHTMSDSQAKDLYNGLAGDLANDLGRSRLKDIQTNADKDIRLGLLCLTIAYDDSFSRNFYEFVPQSNIWDETVPIVLRVRIEPSFTAIASALLDHLLMALMLALFATVLVKQILTHKGQYSYEDMQAPETIGNERFRRLVRRAGKMRWVTIGSASLGTICSVQSVPLLTQWLKTDFGEVPSLYLNLILSLFALVSCITLFAVPKLYNRCGNVLLYTKLSLLLNGIGALICFFAGNSIVFIIGYVVVSVAESFVRMIVLVFSMAHHKEAEGYFVLSRIGGTAVGTLIGSVFGGILALLLDGYVLFLVVAVGMFLLLGLVFTVDGDELDHEIPDTTSIGRILSNRNVLFFCLLVMIPFGFSGYFFSYKVSLDSSAMGLSTILISFISFLRTYVKWTVRGSKRNKRLWKKLPMAIAAPLGTMLSAVVFLAYIPFRSVIGLICVAIALAYVEGNLNSIIYAYNYTLLDREYNSALGNSALIITCRRIGKTVAPILAQPINGLILPIVMMTGGISYLARMKLKKSKP